MVEGVSVIISTYTKDRVRDVTECIKSLRRQTLAPEEIILVLDPDHDLLAFYKSRLEGSAKIIMSSQYGLSEARNAGVRNSTGDIVVFVDDDAFAEADWLRRLVANFDDPSVVGVGGRIKPLFWNARPAWFPEEFDWIIGCSYKGLPEHRASVRNPIGCNMSFRRIAFEKVGLFDSRIGRLGKKLLAGEEADFCSRLLRTIPNAEIVYDPSAIVYHKVPQSRLNLKYVLSRCYYEGLSKSIILDAHPGKSFKLSSEKSYLNYLLRESIPSRLRNFYRVKNLVQLIVVLFSATAVYCGYAVGTLKSHSQKSKHFL